MPILRKASRHGKAKKWHYAYLYDRIQMHNGKYQLYGSQMGGDIQGNSIFWPIKNAPKVNMRRKKVGLSSMEEAAKSSDIPYQASVIDSLRGKVVINSYFYDIDQNL